MLTLMKQHMDVLVPAHIMIDDKARILTLGASLRFHLDGVHTGKTLSSLFDLEMVKTSESNQTDKNFRLVQLTGKGIAEGLHLRGSAMLNDKTVLLLLAHIPLSPDDESARHLRFEDFSPTDSSMDMLIASKLQSVLMEEARELCVKLGEEKKLAEAASVAKSEFLATMSHELRTPLNGILGMAQVLGERDLKADDEKIVDVILQSGDALLSILNDVLDMSKIEAGQLTISPNAEDIVGVVERAAQLHRASAENKGLTFDVTIGPDCPRRVMMDGLRVGQCISNLLSNAIKFTDQGRISLSLNTHSSPDGQAFEIVVRDTGLGIAKAKLQTMFEPFQQADGTTTRKYGGTGLGLSITKTLAELMGGHVTGHSTLGEGAAFTLRLPAILADLDRLSA